MKNLYIESLEDLKIIFAGFVDVANSKIGIKVEEFPNVSDAEGLVKSVMFNTYSLILLAEENKPSINIKDFDWSMIAYPSIIYLARSIFESYLVFHHVFVDKFDNKEEYEYRYALWKVSGFQTRQKFSVSLESSKKKLEQEKKEINFLLSKIEDCSQYKSLKPKTQEKIQEGKFRWRPGWSEMAVNAGIPEKYWKQVYSYMSEFAHGGYLSTLQIRQIKNNTDAKMLVSPSLDIAKIVLARFIDEYNKLQPGNINVLDNNSELFKLVNFWVDISNNLGEIFDDEEWAGSR